MARVIVLDASVLIALRSDRDVHSEAARRVLTHSPSLLVNRVTLTEALVEPARHGRAAELRDLYRAIGIEEWQPDADEPLRVADVRARSRLRLPDAYVLALALHRSATLATFDEELASAARAAGVGVDDGSV